ncbi:MAG TPA: acyltransferase [Tepidisphaeraceae bacterium]|jgi:peptidoglycan/LPS O-acetylase OafA/YrhL
MTPTTIDVCLVGPEEVAVEARPRVWSRIPALDGVRGVAALIVMIFHYYQALGPPGSGGAVARLAFGLTRFGGTGVDLFFVLSGFLITGILLSARGSPNAWTRFYMRRVLRIFPLYYGALLGICVVALLVGCGWSGLRPTVWYWTYLQNVRGLLGGAGFEQSSFEWIAPIHFWSLAVEEHFYLFWPVVVLMVSTRRLPNVLWGIVAGSILSRGLLIATGHTSATFDFTLCRMDALAFGALIAVYAAGDGAPVERLGRSARWATPALIVVAVPMYVLTSGRGLATVQFGKSTLIAALYAAALIVLLTGPREGLLSRALSWGPLRAMGKYSYALYIFHPFVYLGLDEWLAARRPVVFAHAYNPLMCASAMGITFAGALASWHFYEKHFLKLKRFFEYERG